MKVSIPTILMLGFTLVGAPVHAQAPGKVTRIFVGFPPGQATDLVARLVAERLGPALGETVIVENKPGQAGAVALCHLAKSAPDGATMMLSAMAALVNAPHLYKNMPCDTLKDFEPVALVGDLPMLLVVHPSLPVKSLPELITYAKGHPDKLSHFSAGNGTVSHLAMEDLKRRAGITILHVPYQGSAHAMTDLLSGAVSIALETIAATQPHIQSGKMRLIAVGSAKRVRAFPDAPTVAEQGFPGFNASPWLGVLYPAATRRERVERTNAALVAIMQSSEIAQKFATIGALPLSSTPAEFSAFLKNEYARWGEVVKQSGVKVD